MTTRINNADEGVVLARPPAALTCRRVRALLWERQMIVSALTETRAYALGCLIRMWRLLGEPVTAREIQETIAPDTERDVGKRLSELAHLKLARAMEPRRCRLGGAIVKTWEPTEHAMRVYDACMGREWPHEGNGQ